MSDWVKELVIQLHFLLLEIEQKRAIISDSNPNLWPQLIAPPSLNTLMHTQRQTAADPLCESTVIVLGCSLQKEDLTEAINTKLAAP